MKKVLSLLIIFVLALSVAACSSGAGGEKNLEGSLEEILDQIYAADGLTDEFKAFAKDGLILTEITDQNMEYHLGKSGLEFEEAIASEPMMSTSAYALCLVRAGEDTDIEQLKQDIKDNVNPMKWVCVGVDEENVIVDNIGDVVILIMSNTDAEALHEAFLALEN